MVGPHLNASITSATSSLGLHCRPRLAVLVYSLAFPFSASHLLSGSPALAAPLSRAALRFLPSNCPSPLRRSLSRASRPACPSPAQPFSLARLVPLSHQPSTSLSRGFLLALLDSASFYANGEKTVIDGKSLMAHARPYYIRPAYPFVTCSNRDSTPIGQFYSIPGAESVVRGALRYQRFPEFIKAVVDLGRLNADVQPRR